MFDFETRNIMRMNYTYYIALPPAWVKAMKLQPSDPIQIEMDDHQRLIMTPPKKYRFTEGAADE